MSPEQAQGEPALLGPASDAFSMGILLVENLSRSTLSEFQALSLA
jgi:hypothetical protein